MYRCIVVGTDGSESAARAVSHAISLAAVTGAELHLVSAWGAAGTDTAVALLAAGGTVLDTDGPGWVEGMLAEVATQATAAGVAARTHVVQGAPVPVLLDVARSMGADLVVTGNRGMTGIRGVLGSVPNSLAHRAPCAVLVVPTT